MSIITFEFCAEDRARLDRLADLMGRRLETMERLAGLADLMGRRLEALERLAVLAEKDATAEAPEAQCPGQTTLPEATPEPQTEPETAPEPQPEEVKIDRSDIQRKVVELSAAGKKDDVRRIVTTYAKKVSDIPEDKLVEVWTWLNALED